MRKEVLRYLVVGGLTTLVSMALFYSCTWTFLDPNNPFQLQVANVLSWAGAVAFAYVTNRRFVFESKNPNVFSEVVSFVGSRVATLLLDMAVMFVLVTLLSVNSDFAKIVAMVLVTVGNYIISKLLVFKNR